MGLKIFLVDYLSDTPKAKFFLVKMSKKNGFFSGVGCGNYGASSSLVDYDFVHISMASADGTAPLTMATSNFCGGGLVTAISGPAVSGSGTTAMVVGQITICSKYQKHNKFISRPFNLHPEK